MTHTTSEPTPEITYRQTPDGATRIDLMLGKKSASHLFIIPFTLRIGAAEVRMDGIGGVWTEKEYRNRGYSRRVLEATVVRMQQGDAALSMLYGIRDFYPKFGFATAGPDHFLQLTELAEDVSLPAGWRVRPFAAEDLPALQRLYAQSTAHAVGAAVRSATAKPWKSLQALKAEDSRKVCRVVEGPQGQVAGYAWRSKEFWYVEHYDRYWPGSLVLAEVVAEGPAAADAVLAACRAWAAEEIAGGNTKIKRVDIGLAPEGPLATAAMYQSAEFVRHCSPCGSAMARVLNVPRLLKSLLPELQARLRASRISYSGVIHLQTDLGDAVLKMAPDRIAVDAGEADGGRKASPAEVTVRMPQTTLARLALGAFPPEDLLARLETPPPPETSAVLERLFPLRHPHMSLPDRF
jgi:hypothetical protein